MVFVSCIVAMRSLFCPCFQFYLQFGIRIILSSTPYTEVHMIHAIMLSLVQAIIALKKGTHLLKYGRRGKPKFCPFRLSNVIFI